MASRWFKKKCVLVPCYFQEGSDTVAPNLKRLEKCTATVESVYIYKTPLQQGPLQELGAIMHHFLVVEVSAVMHPTRGQNRGGFLIRAEKASRDDDGKTAGIIVQDVHYVEENVQVKYRVDNLNASIPMAELLQILTTHSADYDLVTDNCWMYADVTLRALLNAFGEHRPEDRRVMDNHLQQIPDLVMPADTAATVIKFGLAAIAVASVTQFFYKLWVPEEEEDDRPCGGRKMTGRVEDGRSRPAL